MLWVGATVWPPTGGKGSLAEGAGSPDRLIETQLPFMGTAWNGDHGGMAKTTLKSKLVNLCICHKAKKS